MTRRELLIAAANSALGGRHLGVFHKRDVATRLFEDSRSGDWQKLALGDLVGKIGIALIDTPYVAHTLETGQREACIVNLEGLDCVTFYESCLALARAVKGGHANAAGLIRELTRMRYRDGRIDGYPSRLHYTGDWFYDNARRGLVTLEAPKLPGRQLWAKKIDFMSTHPASYRQLKADPSLVKMIGAQEREMASRKTYYLPKDRIADAEPLLRTGDIVGITTNIDGLDCSHTGLCYRDAQGALRFLHASSKKMKVTLDTRLSEYVSSGAKNTGVFIARPVLTS